MDRKKAIEELVLGRELTTHLQILLHKPLGDDGSVVAEDLLLKIIRSFTQALSALNFSDPAEVYQNPSTLCVNSPCSDDPGCGDSGESGKSPALKDRRGGYKRRRTSETWTKVSPTPIDDGRAWRKYGQKEILNAKYPRSYFRCSHRNDEGCRATKQVQRTEEDPPLYRTTYSGHHTCKDLLEAPDQFILDSSPTESCLLIFESNIPSKQDHQPFFSSFPSLKQECSEDILLSDLTHNHSSLDYLLPPDLTTLEPSGPTTMLSWTPGSDHGDVISGTTSCNSLDMGLEVGSIDIDIDFDDVFHFDKDDFFLESM